MIEVGAHRQLRLITTGSRRLHGSAIVAVRCSIAPSLERVKRSTTCSWSLCLARQMVWFAATLVVSTTSVSPSQRPVRVAETARSLTRRRPAAVHVHRSARVPFPVVQFHPVGTERPDLELMWREHLACQTPRLALEQAGVVGRVERIGRQRGGRQAALDVGVVLVGAGLGAELSDGFAVVGGVVQQRVQPLDAGISAPGGAEARHDCHRRVAPHPFQLSTRAETGRCPRWARPATSPGESSPRDTVVTSREFEALLHQRLPAGQMY